MEKPSHSIVSLFRIADGLLSGVGYAALAAVCGALMRRQKEIGHALLIQLTFVFFTLRAAANFFSVWTEIQHGAPIGPVLVYAVCGIAGWVYAAVVTISYDDILTTLLTSEAEDRRRKRRAEKTEQARLNLDYINTMVQVKSARLVDQQQRMQATRPHDS